MEDYNGLNELINIISSFKINIRFKKCSCDDNVILIISELEQQLSLAEQKLKVIQFDNEKEERK